MGKIRKQNIGNYSKGMEIMNGKFLYVLKEIIYEK